MPQPTIGAGGAIRFRSGSARASNVEGERAGSAPCRRPPRCTDLANATRRAPPVTDQFFDDLARQLDAEPDPTVNDFSVYELLEIVERFATRFDDLPQPQVRSGAPTRWYRTSFGPLDPDTRAVIDRVPHDQLQHCIELVATAGDAHRPTPAHARL